MAFFKVLGPEIQESHFLQAAGKACVAGRNLHQKMRVSARAFSGVGEQGIDLLNDEPGGIFPRSGCVEGDHTGVIFNHELRLVHGFGGRYKHRYLDIGPGDGCRFPGKRQDGGRRLMRQAGGPQENHIHGSAEIPVIAPQRNGTRIKISLP